MVPLESIEILIFNKDWIRPTLLTRHLNLGECGLWGVFPKAGALG